MQGWLYQCPDLRISICEQSCPQVVHSRTERVGPGQGELSCECTIRQLPLSRLSTLVP
jgi:hypothetical protein